VKKASPPGKLWYQRLKLDSNSVVATVFLVIILEYIQLVFTIGLPWFYFWSFGALVGYVSLGVFLLMIFYPRRLTAKFREVLNQLKRTEVISEGVASQVLVNASRQIHGREEKYIPLVSGALAITAWIYSELLRGVFGAFPITDGPTIWSFPLTQIHGLFVMAEYFVIVIVAFSSFVVIWGLVRSLVLTCEDVNLNVMSSSRLGGLDPIGKFVVEVVLLVMILPTIYCAFFGTYCIITSKMPLFVEPAVVIVVLSYGFLCLLILPPLHSLHKVMVREKEEELNQIEHQMKQVPPDDLGELSSLLMIRSEIEKMRTFPLDLSSTRKITLFGLVPILSCMPILLEPYVGKPVFLLPIALGATLVQQLVASRV